MQAEAGWRGSVPPQTLECNKNTLVRALRRTYKYRLKYMYIYPFICTCAPAIVTTTNHRSGPYPPPASASASLVMAGVVVDHRRPF